MTPISRDPLLLNVAMNLALEFGSEWRQRISERLLQRHPKLAAADAEELSRFVADARDWAHGVVASCVLEGSPTEAEARRQIGNAYPWLDESTLNRLWNQGCYYAMKQ